MNVDVDAGVVMTMPTGAVVMMVAVVAAFAAGKRSYGHQGEAKACKIFFHGKIFYTG